MVIFFFFLGWMIYVFLRWMCIIVFFYYFFIFCVLFLLGKVVGFLYEDGGDGFDFKNGDYLVIYYEVERVLSLKLKDGEVVIWVVFIEGYCERLKCMFYV